MSPDCAGSLVSPETRFSDAGVQGIGTAYRMDSNVTANVELNGAPLAARPSDRRERF